jgi:hypothetical protein
MEIDKFKKFYNKLKELNVKYEILEYDEITCLREGIEVIEKIKGEVPMNILLKDQNNNFYLVIKKIDNNINFFELAKKISVSDLKLASSVEINTLLNVNEEYITLFALINDKRQNITVLMDKSLLYCEKINFHPLKKNAMMTINNSDMINFIHEAGNAIIYF